MQPQELALILLTEKATWEYDGKFRVLGGPGSGHHGHKGIPGRRGGSAPSHKGVPKVSGTYPSDPSKRKVSKNFAGHGPYDQVDAAIKAPVRYFNEELGMRSFASCEGHSDNWSDMLGYKYDSQGHTIGFKFQESYIGFDVSKQYNDQLYAFAKSGGFAPGSTERDHGGEHMRSLYMNTADGTHLVLDFKDPVGLGISTLAIRVGTGTIDMSKAKEFEHMGTMHKNYFTSYSGIPPLNQVAWDSARDRGWEQMMQIMTEFHDEHR